MARKTPTADQQAAKIKDEAATTAAETIEGVPGQAANDADAKREDTQDEMDVRLLVARAASRAEMQAAAEVAKSEACSSLEREARQILSEYPAAAEIYITSNGFGFFKESEALNHAATLRDKTIITVKRK